MYFLETKTRLKELGLFVLCALFDVFAKRFVQEWPANFKDDTEDASSPGRLSELSHSNLKAPLKEDGWQTTRKLIEL